jgi:bilirubin oxidase
VFTLTLHDDTDTDQVEFDVIASDCGLYAHPIKTDTLAFSMGERYEIVVDFADFKGKNITMKNARGVMAAPDYAATDLVMRFIVGDTTSDDTNNGIIPFILREAPAPVQANITKNFEFERVGGHWVINGVGWADIEHRILTRPELGADEEWVLNNSVGDGNITGVHPVHIHLVDFQILSRSGGRGEVLPYEAAGQKDVVWLAPGETIRVAARYAPWPGV